MFGRNKVAMLVAEFLGTALLVLSIFAISKSGVGFSLFLAGGLGLAAVMLVLVLGRSIVGYFNPAVSLGLWTAGKLNVFQTVGSIAAQFMGALAAWKLYEYLSDQPLQAAASTDFEPRVMIAEMLGALFLSFGIAAAIYQAQAGLRWASTVGVSVFAGVLIATTAANGIANPAVAMGVQSWDWAYVVGPLVGGVLGVNLYALLYAPIDGETSSRRFRIAYVRRFVNRSRARSTAPKKKAA